MPDDDDKLSPGPDGKPHSAQPKWRKDFPIDVPQDNYVARRDFVKFMVLTSGAFVIGQLSIGVDSIWRGERPAPGRVAIAELADVPVGGFVEFHYPTGNDPCLLVRPDEKTLLAYSQICTHLSCAIQPLVKQGKFHCPCHNGWFDMASGAPTAGPPQRPLPRITLDIADGIVYATGVKVST